MLVSARVIDTPKRVRPRKELATVLPNLIRQPPGTVVVELADGRSVFAPEGSDPEAVRRYIAQQESRP